MTIALFMAAGVGSRIASDIAGLPKCLLEIDGKPNIARNIEYLLVHKNIESIVTIGYQHQQVGEVVLNAGGTAVINEDYRKNNSIVSLSLALDKVGKNQDVLIFNADVCFDFALLEKLEVDSDHVGMLADSSRKIEADYKLIWNSDNVICSYGKDIDPNSASGEYVGFAKVPARHVPQLMDKIDEYLKAGKVNKWWEEVIFENPSIFDAEAIDISGQFWSEFDYLKDYERAEKYFQNKN